MATVSEKIPELTRERALALYRGMVVIRRTEEALAKAHAAGLIQGACHTYVGEEAVATGVSAHLRPDDTVLSTHRGHGHALAKGVPPRELMAELHGMRPAVDNRELIEPLSEDTRTLAEHYRRKRERYELDRPEAYDLRLKRIFGRHSRRRRRLSASTFVRRVRPQLERLLIRRSRLHPYLVHHVLRTVIQRCRELDLVLDTSQREAKRAVLGVLERILMDILRRDRERYAL